MEARGKKRETGSWNVKTKQMEGRTGSEHVVLKTNDKKRTTKEEEDGGGGGRGGRERKRRKKPNNNEKESKSDKRTSFSLTMDCCSSRFDEPKQQD